MKMGFRIYFYTVTSQWILSCFKMTAFISWKKIHTVKRITGHNAQVEGGIWGQDNTLSLLITPEMAKVPDKCLFFVFKDNKLYLEVETSILKVKCKL